MATYQYTLPGTRVFPLTDIERAVTGCSHKFRLAYADWAASGASTATDVLVITLGSTPALWAVDKALLNITNAFTGTGGLAVTVGTTSSAAAFVSSNSLLTVAMIPMVSTLPILTNATGTSSLSMTATLTNSVSGAINALTAGNADLYLNIYNNTFAQTFS